MKNDKEHIRILSTLSLAATDTRKDTLTSIIISSIHQNKVERKILKDQITSQFDFEPYPSELEEVLSELIDSGIIKEGNGLLELSPEEELNQKKLETDLQEKEKQRFQNFKKFITDELGEQLDIIEIKLLWATFVEYLYNNFYEFGEEAVYKLHPHYKYEETINKDHDFFNLASKKLKSEKLYKIFKVVVEKFPEFASNGDLDFLFDLAQKTICFSSLGLDPDKSSDEINNSIINWTLYLDTNILYSLLNLHSHPENEACIALVELINQNKGKLNITLRYSELSKKELLRKKDDFRFLDESLTNNAINGILKSDDLDDFTRKYYQSLLKDRSSTLHPSKVIELSPATLLSKYNIDIGRNKIRLEQIGESYLNLKIQEYRRFIDNKNTFRLEFNRSKGSNFREIYRSDRQIEHDITLRELIIHQRESKIGKSSQKSINSLKCLGSTIDSLLIEFDSKETKEKGEDTFPVFFKPSYLLNKLVRVLPIKTTNYKKAFIKAITTKGFNKDPQKSNDILKIVSYLRKQGIDDETLIYELISKELFLENYNKNGKSQDFNEAKFIESELNVIIKEKEETLVKTKEELDSKNKELENKNIENKALKEKEIELVEKKTTIEGDLAIYEKSLKKLQKEIKRLEEVIEKPTNQSKINFDAEKEKEENKKLRKKLQKEVEKKIQLFKLAGLKKWQKQVWWHLLWVAPITVLGLTFILGELNIPGLIYDQNSLRIVSGVVVLIVDGAFIKLLHNRYDEGQKQKRMENTIIPDDLKRELEDLES